MVREFQTLQSIDKMMLQKLPVLTCFLLFLLTISLEFSDAGISAGALEKAKKFFEGADRGLEYAKKHAPTTSGSYICGIPRKANRVCKPANIATCTQVARIARRNGITCKICATSVCCCYQ